jgi:diguanylate cyclase (GGDEF)-like protein
MNSSTRTLEFLQTSNSNLGSKFDSMSIIEPLRLQVDRLESAVNNVKLALYVFDHQGQLVLVNHPLLQLLGIDSEDELLGLSLIEFGRYLTEKLGPVSGGIARLEPFFNLNTFREKSALNLVFESRQVLHVAHTPSPSGGYVHTLEDVTSKREAEAKASHLASHDVLTNLPNRRLLKQHIDVALYDDSADCAVLCVALDRFKSVNDKLGFSGGDSLLIEFGKRLRACVRDEDTVGRLGGDQFVILVASALNRTEMEGLAQRVVAEIAKPFEVLGHSILVAARVGVAMAPNDGDNADRLIKSADMALFAAKREVQKRYCFFEPLFEREALERQTLEGDLRNAVSKKQFELHYQPVFSARQRKLVGFEALVRWNHPTRGRVAPDEFIPVAEELGLICELGNWIINEACSTAATWPDGICIAVNISARQFMNHDLYGVVTQALLKNGLAPSRLEIEITESALMESSGEIESTLQRFRHQGIGLAMDDFGTGYSSLAYLRRFNFTKVKIDRSFINGLATDTQSIAIVRAILALCKSLNIVVTAEGIETEAQADILRLENCDFLQGYLLGRPTAQTDLQTLFVGA